MFSPKGVGIDSYWVIFDDFPPGDYSNSCYQGKITVTLQPWYCVKRNSVLSKEILESFPFESYVILKKLVEILWDPK